LFFAALATPLVVSVHSVVSWDFAMGVLPGWHTTIFAPYFVAGAIHSGLAMVLTLLIPMRRLLRLERLITIDHFRAVAETMIVTTLIVGYAYAIEPFMAWYSGDVFEQQFAWWRLTGWMSTIYWSLPLLNVLAPLLFLFRRVRTNIAALFVISILVNIGMWLERVFIVVGSTSHDFLPHNWGHYAPTWVEISITVGSFTWFFFWFFLFTKLFPTVSISDLKEDLERDKPARAEEAKVAVRADGRTGTWKVWAIYDRPELLVRALEKVKAAGCGRVEVYSPRRLHETEALFGRQSSPVRFWTLGGALTGLVGGFALAIGTALVNQLVVGAKPPVSILPYCVIGFEGTILLGTLGNFAGMLFHSRLGLQKVPAGYDARLTRDRYGLSVFCPVENVELARGVLSGTEAEVVNVVE
jgi:molybdopterin-containing oxidoreductase family membrane subunit